MPGSNMSKEGIMKLIKEIKTDFGRNVKYFQLKANKGLERFTDCNVVILKVIEMPDIFDTDKLSITEERYYGFIGNEYTTHLEKYKYWTKRKKST